MAYNLSNFTPGLKLPSEDLNKMDEQILQNLQDIKELQKVDNIYNALQMNLELTYDATNQVYILNYIDNNRNRHIISEVPFAAGVDLSTFVACSDLTVSWPASHTGYVGTPITFSYSQSPSDCSQRIAWKVSDVHIASITSQGILTPRACGNVLVTAACGSFVREFNMAIKRTVNLSDKLVRSQQISGDGSGMINYKNPRIKVVDSSASWGFSALMDTSNDFNNNFYIDPGETMTITVGDSGHAVRDLCIFEDGSGVPTELPQTDYSWWQFTHENTNTAYQDYIYNGTPFTYTNTGNSRLYFICLLGTYSNGTFGSMRPDQYDGWLSIEWENAE